MEGFDSASLGFHAYGKNFPALLALVRHQRNRRSLFQRKNILGDNGSADLSFFMGESSSMGRGSPSNPEQAFLWWRDAAERGHIQAMIALGISLTIGYGTPKDRDLARFWLKRAGREGDNKTRYMLAQVYRAVRRIFRVWE